MESSNIIEKLFSSFSELETAINSAKRTLEKKESVPTAILERLNSYDGILAKQKNLANTLCVSISKGDWDEVARNVTLINGLSAMIRDDAKAILQSITLDKSGATEAIDADEFKNFC
jgi:hypothetical protein